MLLARGISLAHRGFAGRGGQDRNDSQTQYRHAFKSCSNKVRGHRDGPQHGQSQEASSEDAAQTQEPGPQLGLQSQSILLLVAVASLITVLTAAKVRYGIHRMPRASMCRSSLAHKRFSAAACHLT